MCLGDVKSKTVQAHAQALQGWEFLREAAVDAAKIIVRKVQIL